MHDVLVTIRRALALVGQRTARRVYVLGFANVVTALLDIVGLVLLVPLLAVLGTGAGAPSTAGDKLVGFVTDITGVTDQTYTVLYLALAATIVFVSKGIASVSLLWIQAGVLNKAELALSRQVVSAYADGPWLAQQNVNTGQLIQTSISAAYGSTVAILGAALSIVSDGAVFVAVFLAILLVEPYLALGAVMYLVIVGFIYLKLIRRTIEGRGRALQHEGQVMNSSLIELSGGIKELTIRGTVSVYVGRFMSANRDYLAAGRLINVSNQGMRYALEALLIGGVGLIIAVSVATSTLAAAIISIGIMLAGGIRLLPALNTLLVSVNLIRSNKAAVSYIDEGLLAFGDKQSPVSNQSTIEKSPRLSGAFAFADVAFSYPERDQPALVDVTIEVGVGETLGVVGSTGSGKSTFVDLLLGLIAPDWGAINVDGYELRAVLAAWRGQIGFVPQDIFLIDETLAANIAFGIPPNETSPDRILRAIELAQLNDVVSELPEGIDTVLGERGVRLSGGQRQRVGLARALYGNPSILVLDEATSALDNHTERKINDALESLRGTMTMVVVAHRLSTVRSCDRILYLEQGRIDGLGTFDELDRTNAGFARLVELGSLRGGDLYRDT